MNPWNGPLLYAIKAHSGQFRRFGSEEPYICHPVRVANMVRMSQYGSDEAATAALLHDVIEDCGKTFMDLENLFGYRVASMVQVLTTMKTPGENRARRKAAEILRLKNADAEVHTIKLADLLDNTKDIVAHDSSFAKVYMREKADLLEVLHRGDVTLYQIADAQVRQYLKEQEGA